LLPAPIVALEGVLVASGFGVDVDAVAVLGGEWRRRHGGRRREMPEVFEGVEVR
jgi:hypothetical protein